MLSVLCAASGFAQPAPAELAQRVIIRRTAYGVPHIKADSLGAAAFGFGFCQAEDHLPSIMRLILKARGESAKHFGGKDEIESDFWSRQFRVRARAIETYHKLDPDFRELIEGFTAGINFYIEEHRAELPEWIQPITPHDAVSHGNTGVMRFAFDRGGIIRRFIAKKKGETVAEEARAEMDEDILAGSNMWALAPSRTASGKAILMGNPHQPWSEVATYYEAHITVPGKLNFYGSTFVGRPVLTTGFNDRLGWSHTVNYPDLEEIYELDLDPNRADHYLFDGGSIPMTREDATVEYKDGDAIKSETRTFWHTALGPVIYREEGRIYIIKSATYEEFRAYQQWFRMSQSKTYDEFRAALDMLAVPMFNICYADREGNIYYLYNGMVPKLPGESHGAEAVHASRSSEIWTQFHPVKELPQLFNPKGGYVQNCNAPPYFTNLNEPMDINQFPPHFERQKLGTRTQHSLRLLQNDQKFSLEDVRNLKFSMGMELAPRVKPALIEAVRATNPQGETLAAIDLLEKWDNTAAAESRGSVLFAEWWTRYAGSVAAPRPDSFEEDWTPEKPMETARGLGNKPRAVEAFGKAIEETKKNFGAIDVPWGEVHRLRKGSVDLPVGGGSGFLGCFRVVDYRKDPDGKRRISGGDSWIFTVEFSEPPRAFSVVGYSQSEIEGSPHFADQAPLYANNQMKPVAFAEEDIQAQLERSYRPGE